MVTIIPGQQAYELVHRPGFTKDGFGGYHVSDNFSWAEVFHNRTQAEIMAAPLEVFVNASHQAQVMEAVRSYLRTHFKNDAVINVTSWYRSPQANAAVGGAKNSSHLKGMATDFVIPGYDSTEGCQKVQAALIPAHKTIGFCLEITGGSWVHVDCRQGWFVFQADGHTLSVVEESNFVKKHGGIIE